MRDCACKRVCECVHECMGLCHSGERSAALRERAKAGGEGNKRQRKCVWVEGGLYSVVVELGDKGGGVTIDTLSSKVRSLEYTQWHTSCKSLLLRGYTYTLLLHKGQRVGAHR